MRIAVYSGKRTLDYFLTLIWNRGILLWWYRLWVRKSEMHASLHIDHRAEQYMSDVQIRLYRRDIAKRRMIAHKRF